MKALNANFAVPWRPGQGLWLLALAGVAAAAVLWGWCVHQTEVIGGLRSEIAQVRADPDASATNALAPPAFARAYDASAREMLGRRTADWVHALGALESLPVAAEVTTVEVEIASTGNELRVHLLASGYAPLLDWLATLNAASAGQPGGWQWSPTATETDSSRGLRAHVLASRGADRSTNLQNR